jgi:hypothetical protein
MTMPIEITRLLAVTVVAALTVACDWPFARMLDPFVHELLEGPTAYTEGRATLEITSLDPPSVVLDRLGNATVLARYDPFVEAAQAEWTDASGRWLLTVLTPPQTESPVISTAQLSIDWGGLGIDPPRHADGSGCSVNLTEVSASRLAGIAECFDLRWVNGYEAAIDPATASPIPGLRPFDAVITFEATP